MRRLLFWAARLYPRRWRARYGAEFVALLEDAGGGWRVLFDVLREAMTMRMLSMNFRVVAACTLAGIAVASVVAWRTPDRFVSTAVGEFGSGPAGVTIEETFSRTTLAGIVNQFDLYRQERRTASLESIVDRMKQRDLRFTRLQRTGGTVFSLRFEGTDAVKTQQVTEAMMARLHAHVLDPASPPNGPFYPNRKVMVGTGMAGGLFAGLSAAFLRRRRPQ